jgi:uncharacterized protein YbjT (DUF2867 family)
VPVVVTGASGFIGRRAVAAFARVSPQVRAYVRRKDAVPLLRDLGAKVAVGEIDVLDNLAAVMAGAHTICHLVGGLNQPDEAASLEANLGSVRAVLRAAQAAAVPRLIFLSYPGAASGAANPYLRTKGLAEEAIHASGLQHAIIRSTHVYGPGGEWLEAMRAQAARWPALVVGSGRPVLAPVFVEDLGAVLAAADDRRASISGTWGLEGPDRVTADGFVDLLAGKRKRKLHAGPGAAAKMAGLLGPRVSGPALEVLAADSLADAPDAAKEFGVTLTSLAEGLDRSGVARASRAAPRPGGPSA